MFKIRVGVLGAGSLGTIIGAFITAGGQDVELIDVNETHVRALNRTGATIIGTTEFTTPVKAITPDDMSGTYDLVLLLTKQFDNALALRNLLPYIGKHSIVISLQNGIPEQMVASFVGRERVVAGSAEFGGTWMEPGVSSLTTAYDHFKKSAFQIGELNGETTDRIQQIQSILSLVGGTHVSDNLVGIKWSKLLINNSFSGLSAALNCTFGEVADNDIAVYSAASIIDETIKVGHARNVKFAPMLGYDFASLQIEKDQDIPHRVQVIRFLSSSQRSLKASMLQDLEKNRKTEIDYINGVMSEQAQGTGIVTPYNNLVVKLVKEAEKQQTVPHFGTNIKFFEELCRQIRGQ